MKTMRKITDLQSLDMAIFQLEKEIEEKEKKINVLFEESAKGFEPAALMNAGFKSLLQGSTVQKTMMGTAASILVGFLIERVILRKSNVLVKYGIAHVVMNLVSRLAAENFQPDLMQRLRDALMSAIQSEEGIIESPTNTGSDAKETSAATN